LFGFYNATIRNARFDMPIHEGRAHGGPAAWFRRLPERRAVEAIFHRWLQHVSRSFAGRQGRLVLMLRGS
jgi:hypothetical protein